MSAELADQKCVPCRGGVPAMAPAEIQPLLNQLEGWSIVDGIKLAKHYPFDDFMGPVRFTNEIARVAEEEGHHPDLYVRWGEVRAYIWTHKVNGLTHSDFVMAAKIDRLYEELGRAGG